MIVLEIREVGMNDNDGTVLIKFRLQHGKVVGEGSEELLDSLERGVCGLDKKMYTPKDGIAFLKAVQEHYADSNQVRAKLL